MTGNTLRVLREGTVAGLIGYAVVAIVFAVANIMDGHSPFHTASVLGATLFDANTPPAAAEVDPGHVLAFNGVHLIIFLLFGGIGAWLARLADRGDQLWYVSLFFWLFVAFHMIGSAQMMAIPLEAVIAPAAIWLAGILASVAMALYLLRSHPLIRRAQVW